jgi:hypothetical protein
VLSGDGWCCCCVCGGFGSVHLSSVLLLPLPLLSLGTNVGDVIFVVSVDAEGDDATPVVDGEKTVRRFSESCNVDNRIIGGMSFFSFFFSFFFFSLWIVSGGVRWLLGGD